MRRVLVMAFPLALVVACSSVDDVPGDDLEHATIDSGEAPVAPAADGRSSSSDASAGTDAAAGDAATGPDYEGEATYYDADGTGACGFKATPTDLSTSLRVVREDREAQRAACIAWHSVACGS